MRYGPSKLALHFGVRIRSNFTFMGIFGTHIGISRITFSEHKFRGLSEFLDLYRSRPDSLMGKSYGDFREMDENLFFHEGALFRTFFSPFLLFLALCFRIRYIHRKYALFIGD